MRDLKFLRSEIDTVDQQIVNALNKRAELVLEVKAAKERDKIDIYSPSREREIIERTRALAAEGKFPLDSVETIFREVVSATRSLIGELAVAYLGPKRSLSHDAARAQFGERINYYGFVSVIEVFKKVESDEANFGVIPVETPDSGVYTPTIEAFLDSDLEVVAEIEQEKPFCLLSANANLNEIKRVYAAAGVFVSISAWLAKNLPNAERMVIENSDIAAERVLAEDHSGLIGVEELTGEFPLNLLARDLESGERNMARFFVIGRHSPSMSGRDRTTILGAVKDHSGALHEMLSPFAKYDLTLTKIESKPMKNRHGDYIFFIDILGHKSEPIVAKALEEVKEHCSYIKILGSYPVGPNRRS